MQLMDMTTGRYLDLIASDAPAPGGGSAAALCGAQGAALVAMVAGLSVGREKYAAWDRLCRQALESALSLKARLSAQAQEDCDAYAAVSRAFGLPRQTEGEKALRAQAISSATLAATRVPFDTMALGLEGLELAQNLVGRSNPNAASDLGVAALNLDACVRGAWLNVLINLEGLEDESAGRFSAQGRKMVDRARALAEGIYEGCLGAGN